MTGGSWQLSAAVKALGTLTPQGVASTLADPSAPVSGGAQQVLTYGATSGAFDTLVFQPLTLNATTAATYDLYTGSDLKDVFGANAPLRKVKSIAVWVSSGGDTAGVRVGGAAANAWAGFFADTSDRHLIFPSGPPYLGGSPDGVAVGSSTKNLKIENLGAVAVTFFVAIAGTSV